MPFAKGHPKLGGRHAGVPNKATQEIKTLASRLLDEIYWASLKRRLDSGRAAPALELRLWAYLYGEPKQTVDIPGFGDVATLLARKVIHKLQPGPSRELAPAEP